MPSQPLPDVPNGLQIKISGLTGGQPFMHVLHAVHAASTPNATDLATLAATISTSWNTNIKVLQNTGVTMNSVIVTDISSRTGAVGSDSTQRIGTLAGTALPNSAAYAVRWLISRRYRGGHPRTYHTGLVTSQTASTFQVSTAFRTSIIAAYTALKASIEGSSLTSVPSIQMCQVSYYHGKNTDGTPALRPVPIVDVITGVGGDQRLDSQRHRLGKPL